MTYDFNTGEMLTSTDGNNYTTTYIYDNIGRVIKIINPDSTISTVVYDDYANMKLKLMRKGIIIIINIMQLII